MGSNFAILHWLSQSPLTQGCATMRLWYIYLWHMPNALVLGRPSKTQLICCEYKLACPNWCCQLLPCSDGELCLVRWWQICEVLQLQTQKNVQNRSHYMYVGIVWLESHLRARQCTSTQLARWLSFWLVRHLTSATCCHKRTRLSSPHYDVSITTCLAKNI